MPENNLPPFVKLKKMFKDCAVTAGEKLSDRNAHRMAQGFLLSHAAEDSELQYNDETGEDAVKNALISYIRKHGSLRAPVSKLAVA